MPDERELREPLAYPPPPLEYLGVGNVALSGSFDTPEGDPVLPNSVLFSDLPNQDQSLYGKDSKGRDIYAVSLASARPSGCARCPAEIPSESPYVFTRVIGKLAKREASKTRMHGPCFLNNEIDSWVDVAIVEPAKTTPKKLDIKQQEINRKYRGEKTVKRKKKR